MNQWFRRLAEVPGIEYECSPNIDRSLLPEHDAIPEIGTFSSLNGKIYDFIRWKTTEGSTSASPAHRWQGSGSGQLPTPRPNETQAQAILRQLQETLELPGILSDYHHALNYCCESLWKNRRSEPWVIAELERLYLLEIQLAEIFDISGMSTFQGMSAFESLIRLYEKEGYLREAFALAQRLDILYPRDESKDYWRETSTVKLQPRIDRLEAEDDA